MLPMGLAARGESIARPHNGSTPQMPLSAIATQRTLMARSLIVRLGRTRDGRCRLNFLPEVTIELMWGYRSLVVPIINSGAGVLVSYPVQTLRDLNGKETST